MVTVVSDAERAAVIRAVHADAGSSIQAHEVAVMLAFIASAAPRQRLSLVQREPWLAAPRALEILHRVRSASAGLRLTPVLTRFPDCFAWLMLLVDAQVRPEQLRLPHA